MILFLTFICYPLHFCIIHNPALWPLWYCCA
jgi:hypothetical protein